MDPRRLLTLAAAGALLTGCAVFRPHEPPPAWPALSGDEAAADSSPVLAAPAPVAVHDVEPAASTARPYMAEPPSDPVESGAEPLTGRRAIAAANAASRAASREDGFVGSVQVFAWSPGRVVEVWTAPLRVTPLSLAPGEILITKAAGDTVRWQIGEAVSGAGAGRRTHIMLKPLQRGLETNLVLTTNRRVYLIDLKSGAPDAFNPAVSWGDGPEALEDDRPIEAAFVDTTGAAAGAAASAVVLPEGDLDGRYRIEPQGRRARWTPTSVFNDGVRTFITFDPDLQVDEAPVLFVIAADGQAEMVNYRQIGGLYVVDRIFDRAELRLGDRRPQIVRIRRLAGGRS